MKRKIWLALACMAGSGSAALANASLSVTLDLDVDDEVLSSHYVCDADHRIAVHYVNAGANNLALIPVDGDQRVFVNVISGSGARYVSGQYEWWSKGDMATLSNLTGNTAALECQAEDGPAGG